MVNEVTIPFQEVWREAMLCGRKTCTTRTRRYGKEDDEFEAFGARFRIECVYHFELAIVRERLWREEGCESPEEFEAAWGRLHPRKGFDPTQRVFVHWFTKIRIEEEQDG